MANPLVVGDTVDTTLQKANYVPTNISRQDLVSSTNHAYECFVRQKFSKSMQLYLISYVLSVNSFQAIYK